MVVTIVIAREYWPLQLRLLQLNNLCCENTILQWDNFHCEKPYCHEKIIDVTMIIATYGLLIQYVAFFTT
jgi:hypothetical protein